MAARSSLQGSFPIPRTRLFGREIEREVARNLLLEEAVPLLTLTGPGGIGKTRLALTIASDVTTHFADGVVWVDLAPLTDASFISATVAAALSLPVAPDQPITLELIRQLRPQQTLLLCDNCEHVLSETAVLVATLLASCPALQVLATSRAPLQVQGEQLLPVDPLSLPIVDAAWETINGAAAVRLFTARARAVRPAFRLDPTNAATVALLCHRLDGLPLAIELAAAQSAVLSPAAMLAQMTDRLRLLRGGAHDRPARQRTMHDAIAWSYDLLTEAEQKTFRGLAVFTGGCTLAAAAAVLALDEPTAQEHLTRLVAQSLLTGLVTERSSRFTMLETIRAFGLERIQEDGEDEAVRDHHAAFFRRFVAERDLYNAFPGDRSWLDEVAPEEANLRQALERLLTRGDTAGLSELSSHLIPFWVTRARYDEGRRWLERAIAGDQDLPTVLRSRAREGVGLFLSKFGANTAAAPLLEEAVLLARASGDQYLLLHSLQSLGGVVGALGDYPRAMALHGESEQVARALAPDAPHTPLFIGSTLCMQGLVARWSGDHEAATVCFQAAEPYLRKPGGSRRLSMILSERGVIQIMRGALPEATATLIEALARTWETRYDDALTRTLRGLAAVAAVTEQRVVAAQLLGAADAIYDHTPFADVNTQNNRDIIAWCLDRLMNGFDAPTLNWQRQIGASFATDRAVALARAVAVPVLGSGRVTVIWQATGAADPGPAPAVERTDGQQQHPPDQLRFDLTHREREVLTLLGQRLTNAEIAERLYIGQSTVITHVSHLIGKLGATNRREAAAIAVRYGLI